MNDIRSKVASRRAFGEPDLPLASKINEYPLLVRLPHSNHAIRSVVKEGAAAIKSISPPPQQLRNVVGMDDLPKHLVASESIAIWRRRFDTPFSWFVRAHVHASGFLIFEPPSQCVYTPSIGIGGILALSTRTSLQLSRGSICSGPSWRHFEVREGMVGVQEEAWRAYAYSGWRR
jgi:hypothetical protein